MALTDSRRANGASRVADVSNRRRAARRACIFLGILAAAWPESRAHAFVRVFRVTGHVEFTYGTRTISRNARLAVFTLDGRSVTRASTDRAGAFTVLTFSNPFVLKVRLGHGCHTSEIRLRGRHAITVHINLRREEPCARLP